MGDLLKHAKEEFKRAGWVDKEGKFSDDMQEDICNHVLKLLKVFSEEGHSGSSAPYAINLFAKLAKFELITPLTGEEDEWVDVSGEAGKKFYQNKRFSRVFKYGDGQAYDIEGKVFWEWCLDQETGEYYKAYFTNGDSKVSITFPYAPTTEYVERISEDG